MAMKRFHVTEIDTDFLERGDVDKALSTFDRLIGHLRQDRVEFKIGITSDPQGQATSYGTSRRKMYLLYETKNHGDFNRVARILYDKYGAALCEFSFGGHGGSSLRPPYFAYLVW